MIVFEDRSPSYMHSLQVVVETYTGTGYGSDSPWESFIANALVSAMDLSTFLLVFIILPYVLRPVVENALTPRIPTETDLTDHVIICGIEHQGRRVIDEFEARDVEYVVIVDSEEEAIELVEEDISVIRGNPTSAESFANAGVDDATAVIVDTADRHAASVILAVRDLNESVRTIVLVENLANERHLRYAGADRVLTPRHLLGQRIAERITTEISPTRTDSITLGHEFSILELTVFEQSPINCESIDSIESMTTGSITIIGLWTGGDFRTSPEPDTVVDENTVLLVAGNESDVRELERETYRGRDVEPTVIIAGYGIVGSTVLDELRPVAVDCTVVDIEDGEDVDVVGDVTNEETLDRVGLDEATVFVVTIADDEQAILSVLLANQLASDLDIIVRTNHDANETKVRRAGADYVLSLPEMSGRVLAEEVLHDDLLSYSRQLKPVRLEAGPFAGQQLENTAIAETNCLLIAVERDGELITNLSGEFEIQAEDSLLVIGRDDDVDSITE